ncbi:hypothetical protein ID866_8407 [Astraeus odoratus]|nr:hypothetical protein ID866_8407 [Astraeus odoratus]
MLVGYANCPPGQQPQMCGWLLPHTSTPCNMAVLGDDFSAHLRDYHGVHGNDKAKVYCRWLGCNLQMNKESVARHVAEMHLQRRHYCYLCPETFSRKNTLNSHVQKKHNEYVGRSFW